MAEQEPVRRVPDAPPPGTVSWEGGSLFDVRAVEGTGSYPINPTASFPSSPTGDDRPPTISAGGIEMFDSPDLPRIPGYRIVRVVGQGGMGTVFEAVHLATSRTVALKVINAGWADDNDFRARFAREVKTLAALKHENIVTVYDAGTWQGLPFLTMEYVACKTLAHHLTVLRRDLSSAAQMLAQVARAVDYLHTNGIVHRDLKPLNILITSDNKPMVADFGLVRPIDDDSELSLTLVPLGTRQYMSPEQTRGGRGNYKPSCDIWALGIILYELLAGFRPFEHEDTVELFHQIRTAPPPRIPLGSNSAPGLETIMRKCLQKSSADRYATAAELAHDLDRWCAGEEIPPLPEATPPVALLTPVPSRRLRYIAAAAMVLMLVPLIVGVIYSFNNRNANGTTDENGTKSRLPIKTIAERLRAGETVELIGANGLPNHAAVLVPPFTTPLVCDKDGFCCLNSANYAFVMLSNEELPCAVRVEAEVAFYPNVQQSWGGVFAGLKDTPTNNIPHKSCLMLQQRTSKNVRDHTILLKERGQLTVTWLSGNKLPEEVEYEATTPVETEIKAADAELPRWCPFVIGLTPEKATAKWGQKSFQPVSAVDTLSSLHFITANLPLSSKPEFELPIYGPGIGLCVHNGVAMYRNVRLIPLP